MSLCKSTTFSINIRHFSSSAGIPEDLIELMHGRKNRERRDSVTVGILKERQIHQERIRNIVADSSITKYLDSIDLGCKRKRKNIFNIIPNIYGEKQLNKTRIGAVSQLGGNATHLNSASSSWPIFDHLLPEVAFAGHSNSGKSTLVNVMAGLAPRKGPASVSERAGWTDQVCFYQLGKRPPILTLVDFPGYGHAVASIAEIRAWKKMTLDYITNREVLSLCCVLVDCTRGLCDLDKSLLKKLIKLNIPRLVILTKADLLSANDLAGSIAAVKDDLQELVASTTIKPFTDYKLHKRKKTVNNVGSLSSSSSSLEKLSIGTESLHNREGVEEEGETNDNDTSIIATTSTTTNDYHKDKVVIVDTNKHYDEDDDSSTDLELDIIEEVNHSPSTATTEDVVESLPGAIATNQPTHLGYFGIIAISASSGAGVQSLWNVIKSWAIASACSTVPHSILDGDGTLVKPHANAVKEHKRANELRKRVAVEAATASVTALQR